VLANAVFKIIEDERRKNPLFVRSFDDFYTLCRQAINPNLSAEALERMLIQHLLTERIFRKIFNNPDFTRRNIVAQEISAANSPASRSPLPPAPPPPAPPLLCHLERSRIVQRTIPWSRGTPRLPTPSCGLERSSLHKVRPAVFMVRTPLYAGWQLKQTRGLSTP
jgi:hypothetical protein